MAWPRRPPQGQRCDASTGSGSDPYGAPVIYRCQQPATETTLWGAFEMWLCADHAEALGARGQVRRNPKRKASR